MDVGVEASKAPMPLRETMANENDPEFDGAENWATTVLDHEESNHVGPELWGPFSALLGFQKMT